jgi:hypothetical protein
MKQKAAEGPLGRTDWPLLLLDTIQRPHSVLIDVKPRAGPI